MSKIKHFQSFSEKSGVFASHYSKNSSSRSSFSDSFGGELAAVVDVRLLERPSWLWQKLKAEPHSEPAKGKITQLSFWRETIR